MTRHFSRLIAVSLALIVLVAATGVVLAAASSATGKAQTQIKVVRENATTGSFTTKSTVYADVPNATVAMTVPAGTNALLVARFQAHGSIIQNPGCMARILVGATTMEPSSNYAIFAQFNVSESVSANGSIERSLAVGPGTHTVKVQMRISQASNINSECQLAGWHFAVERHKQ